MTPPTPEPAADAMRAHTHTGLADAVERLAASVAGIAGRRQAASGLMWQPGVVVTSASAVWRASKLQLLLPGGEPVAAEVQGLDAATDLAALRYAAGEAPPLPPLERAAADAPPPRVGDFVFAVGREPSGRVQASFGHVGAAGGEWRSWRGGRVERLIRLDGGLYPGLAGAPVADAGGRCIGIASPAFSRLHGVVLPLATVDRVVAALLAHGRVARGYLGVAVQPVRATLDGAGIDGLLVSAVADDGPAARAGLLVGDVIVSLNGAALPHVEALRSGLDAAALGSPLALKVARGGHALELAPVLADRPSGGCR